MKKLLLLLTTFLTASSLYSQISFQEHEITSYTPGAGGNRMADLDNDGDMDIVTFGRLGVDWYENTFPQPGFLPRQTVAAIPGTNYIQSIDITDFDGDGDLDIIGAELFQDKLFLCTNLDGQGTFAPFEVLKTVEQISFVKHIDMDNDGDKDLFYQRSGSNGQFTGYLENQSNNYTILHTAYSLGEEIALADFDNDGLPDLFFRGANYIAWVKNNGGGNFSDIIPINTLNNHCYHFDIADIDSDGDLDLVGNVENNIYITKLIYKLNDGSGNFAPEVIIRQNISEIKALRLGDVDNDAKPDLIVTIRNSNSSEYFSDLQWYKNTGSNVFADMPVVDVKLRQVFDIETSDVTNDGINDIVILSNAHRTTIYAATGSGAFGGPKHAAAANLQASCAVSGDVDADGDLDIVTSSLDDSKIYLYKNNANVYQNQVIVNHDVNAAKEVALADIDGDNDLDIVCVSGDSDTGSADRISWYKNLDGLGNFGPQINIPIGIYDSPDGLAVYDVDADGDKDIVTSLDNWPDDGDKIVWYSNNGSGGFSGEQIIASGPDGVRALQYEDIDNDGDLDLIFAASLDNMIGWLENVNGSGSFGPMKIISDNAQRVVDFAIADYDSDGDNDVAYMTNGNVRDILWQPNDGLGNFGAARMVNSNVDLNGASAIAAADLDNDADIDIVVGESTQTVWCENLYGQANFEPPKIISTSVNSPSGAQIVDGDNDGDMDILLASNGANSVVLFKNQGLSLNTIKGTIRLDIEGNGCGANDRALPDILVSTTDGTNTIATLTFRNEHAGKYRLYTGEGNFETTATVTVPNYYMLTPLSHDSSFTGFGNMDTADFCIEPIGQYNDLSINLYPLDEARPGFDASYQLIYRNVGTTVLTGQATLAYDNARMQFLNASTAPGSQTPNTLVYSFTDLMPFETRSVKVNFNVFPPPTTNISENLVFTATADPVQDDHTPVDNVQVLNQIVIGSYDPNDITCLEGDAVLVTDADKFLHYVIRFQNSGTASAINVRVQHQLDSKLDWSTLQLEGMSHNGRTTITDESLVEFTFNNIYLPHSAANEPGSHGYIMFKIKPRANSIVLGDIVDATADIFFDFNPPITTNTASTTYVDQLSVSSPVAGKWDVYPNPTNGLLNIETNSAIGNVSVMDVNGRILKEFRFDAAPLSVQLDVKELTSGIYFLNIKSEKGSVSRKIIKN